MYNLYKNSVLLTKIQQSESDVIYGALKEILNDITLINSIKIVEYAQLSPPPNNYEKKIGEYYYDNNLRCFVDKIIKRYINIPYNQEFQYLVINIENKIKNKNSYCNYEKEKMKINEKTEKKTKIVNDYLINDTEY